MSKSFRLVLAVFISVMGFMGALNSGSAQAAQEHPIPVPVDAVVENILTAGATFTTDGGDECATAGSPRIAIQVSDGYIFGYFGSSAATLNDCELAGADLVGNGLWESPATGGYVTWDLIRGSYATSPILSMFLVDEPIMIEDAVPFATFNKAAPGAASVAGQVLEDQTGTPLVGADVCIDQTDQCTTSVDGGYYAIGGVSAGDYTVTASLDGYGPQTLAHTVAGETGGPTFYLAPAVPDAASVAGQVFENLTGVPLVGADVCIDGTDQCAVSVAGGYYAIGGVFNGDYFVTASLAGYGPQTLAVTVAGENVGPNFFLDPVVVVDPELEVGTLEIVKWFCPGLTEVDTSGNITDDCYHGNAVFTVYLYGDGTDDVIAQVETGDDGNVVVELAPGEYEVVEESTLVKMDVTIVAGKNFVISFANPVDGDGNGTDNGVDNGDDNGAGHDADNGKGADAGKDADADKHADAGKAADGKDADAGKAADGKKTEEVKTLPSTGSGQAASSQAWMLMAGAAILSAVGSQVTRRQTNS